MEARNNDIRTWFRLEKAPFTDQIKTSDLFLRESLENMYNEINFAIKNGCYYTVIGDVGSGKSTALRYAQSKLNSKEYQIINLTGGSWSFSEFLRQTMAAIGIPVRTGQQTTMLRMIYDGYKSIKESGKTPVLFIDEAHLYNPDVFHQIHLLSQPDKKTGQIVPIVLCGQSSLIDRLLEPFNKPLQSRILNGINIPNLSIEECGRYIEHHISVIAKGPSDLFDEGAKNLIMQSSGGLPRLINKFCLLAMNNAMSKKENTISSDNVRAINTKWWER